MQEEVIRFRSKSNRMGIHPLRKAVHMSIDKPVLDEYNCISLDKSSKYQRIRHRCTKQQDSCQQTPLGNLFWEDTVASYIESKKKIQLRRGNLDINFRFHKLDKTNKHRYHKLIQEQAIPLDRQLTNPSHLSPQFPQPDRQLLTHSLIGHSRNLENIRNTQQHSKYLQDTEQSSSFKSHKIKTSNHTKEHLHNRKGHQWSLKDRGKDQLKQIRYSHYSGIHFKEKSGENKQKANIDEKTGMMSKFIQGYYRHRQSLAQKQLLHVSCNIMRDNTS